MVETIINNFEIWAKAQTLKTKGRGISANNQKLHGVNKLRELILDLAIRGKLVEQDANNEPAKELLKKSARRKVQLIKNGEIKGQELSPEIGKEEKLFKLPESWEWCRLHSIVSILGDGIHGTPTYSDDGQYYFINGNNLNNGLIELKSVTKKVDEAEHLKHRRELNNSTVLVSINGTIGNVAFYNGENVILGKSACYFNLIETSVKPYIKLLIESNYFRSYAFENATGTTIENVSLKTMRNFVIPFPPLLEQHRIVAKVDELMALCDQLEQSQTDCNAAHEILVETLLDTLTNATGQAELESAWERIANHSDTLFVTEHSVERLKQTILQLAVMGKLVPQNLEDEPAGELLKKIGKEKTRLVKEGKIKKQDSLPDIRDEERSLEMPNGWEFVRLGNIANKIGSGSTPRGSAYEDSGIVFLRSQNVWNHGLELNDVAYISKEMHQKMSNTAVYPNDILLNITGASLGRSAIFPSVLEEANVSQHVTIIRPTFTDIKEYLHLCIQSPYIQKLVWGRQVGMAREGLSKKVLELFEIPLPPLAEQHRIVAKVDELFGICDMLKERIRDAQGIQMDLADAVVEGALK